MDLICLKSGCWQDFLPARVCRGILFLWFLKTAFLLKTTFSLLVHGSFLHLQSLEKVNFSFFLFFFSHVIYFGVKQRLTQFSSVLLLQHHYIIYYSIYSLLYQFNIINFSMDSPSRIFTLFLWFVYCHNSTAEL